MSLEVGEDVFRSERTSAGSFTMGWPLPSSWVVEKQAVEQFGVEHAKELLCGGTLALLGRVNERAKSWIPLPPASHQGQTVVGSGNLYEESMFSGNEQIQGGRRPARR